MRQFSRERAEDFFRSHRAIGHVLDWPAHDEPDAEEREVDLDSARRADRFNQLMGVVGAGDEAGEIATAAVCRLARTDERARRN